MPEALTDQEREELKAEARDERKKKEMTIDEIMSCPTWDCDGGPEIVKEYDLPDGREAWMVWCPKCRGWATRYVIGKDQEPYSIGARLWEEFRRGLGH